MARHQYFVPHASATPRQIRAFEILFGKMPGDTTRQVVDMGITLLVLASIIAIILESLPSLHDRYSAAFYAFEVFSIAMFTAEYIARIWCVPAGKSDLTPTQARLRYMRSFHGLIDLCATLPFYLQALIPGLDLRFMRAVRMLRFLKLSHYSTALE